MKKLFLIGLKDLKIRSRDFNAFIMILLMPLILIFVLGLVFQPLYSSKPFIIDTAVVNLDNDYISDILINDVLKSEELSKFINLFFLNDENELKDSISKGKYAVGIIINENFTKNIVSGKEDKILILADPEQTTKSGVIKNILDTFVLEVVKRSVALDITSKTLIKENLIKQEDLNTLIYQWSNDIENIKSKIGVKLVNEKGEETRGIVAMDYYAVGMGVMYLLFAANAGTESIFEEKRKGTYQRLSIMPIKESSIFSGKVFGIFLLTLTQFILIILITKFFYGVSWGNSFFGLIIMVISSVLCFSGLSILFASLMKSESQVGSIGSTISMILGFVGGSMWPIFTFPKWLNTISKFTPNRWAIDGFFKLIFESGNAKDIIPHSSILILMTIIFYSIGLTIFR
ncbi:MAG TPA: ABC transporter permease, partial [Caldisericia bacterium]|nr:ABC transporter permease [Caldisericia bacterium]